MVEPGPEYSTDNNASKARESDRLKSSGAQHGSPPCKVPDGRQEGTCFAHAGFRHPSSSPFSRYALPVRRSCRCAIQDSEDKVWFGPVGLGVGQAAQDYGLVYAIGNPNEVGNPNDRPWEFTVQIFNRQGKAVQERTFRVATGVIILVRGRGDRRSSGGPTGTPHVARRSSASTRSRIRRENSRRRWKSLFQPGHRSYSLHDWQSGRSAGRNHRCAAGSGQLGSRRFHRTGPLIHKGGDP